MEFTTHGQDQGLGMMYRVEVRWVGSWDDVNERVTHSWPKLHVAAYPVAKVTPKGKWITVGYSSGRRTSDKRFILNEAFKRFAHETKEAALEAFQARKQRQIKILEAQLNGVRETLQIAVNCDVEKLQCYD